MMAHVLLSARNFLFPFMQSCSGHTMEITDTSDAVTAYAVIPSRARKRPQVVLVA